MHDEPRHYGFTLTGRTALLMHADDVMASDDLTRWRKDPKNKSVSTPGDDRSPAWTWQTYLYTDGKHIVLPQESIMAAIRFAGSRVASKGKSTFKSMSQSGLMITDSYCEFLVAGKKIAIKDVFACRDRPFVEHMETARSLGFDLHVKRATIGMSKNVRVRACFSDWQVRGSLCVDEPAITDDVLTQLFEISGRLAGLGDWRPSAPKKPGPYGMFKSEIKRLTGSRKA